MKLSIFEIAGKREVLAGAPAGKNLLAKIIPKIQQGFSPTPLFLDCTGVEVVTASYIREGILGTRDYCLNSNSNVYPVIANANKTVIDEIEIELKHRGEALLSCKLDSHGNVAALKLIGVLEEKQQLTLEAVNLLRQTDATTLMEKFKDRETIGITGWNNRLSALAAKGLLVETKKGKTKIYQPILECN